MRQELVQAKLKICTGGKTENPLSLKDCGHGPEGSGRDGTRSAIQKPPSGCKGEEVGEWRLEAFSVPSISQRSLRKWRTEGSAGVASGMKRSGWIPH